MAKRARRTRRAAQSQERGTNWWIIGGIAGVGIIALFALLFLTLQAADSPEPTSTPFAGQPWLNIVKRTPIFV